MKLTDLSVSIRSLVTLSLLVFVVNVHAQTARQFTLNLTDDGKAQMVCFLPQTPSGKAVVGVPGGGLEGTDGLVLNFTRFLARHHNQCQCGYEK